MTGPLELNKIAYRIFSELMVLLAIHGRFLSFCFHYLLSAHLCGSDTTVLAQTFLRSKCFFRIVCTLPSDMPVQLAISLTDNRTSYSTTIFTAVMLALVTKVLDLPGRVSSSTENFPALKALTHLKTVRIEIVLRSIYTTQFIKYLLWIYIKPNAAFNIATNFSLLVHVPM